MLPTILNSDVQGLAKNCPNSPPPPVGFWASSGAETANHLYLRVRAGKTRLKNPIPFILNTPVQRNRGGCIQGVFIFGGDGIIGYLVVIDDEMMNIGDDSPRGANASFKIELWQLSPANCLMIKVYSHLISLE